MVDFFKKCNQALWVGPNSSWQELLKLIFPSFLLSQQPTILSQNSSLRNITASQPKCASGWGQHGNKWELGKIISLSYLRWEKEVILPDSWLLLWHLWNILVVRLSWSSEGNFETNNSLFQEGGVMDKGDVRSSFHERFFWTQPKICSSKKTSTSSVISVVTFQVLRIFSHTG